MSISEDLGTVERSETLTAQTYRRLRHALMTGTLAPGKKITGRLIAGALNVSLTPAREAIGRLVAEGGLSPGSNRAAFVPKITKADYQEILSARLLLEGLAAESAVEHLDADRLAEIERAQREGEEAADREDYVAMLQKNADFHFLIYRAAKLPIIFSIIDSLWLRVGPTLTLLTPGYQQSRQGTRNHLDAIDAIRQRSGKRLKQVIKKDLNDGASFILPLLDDQ